MNQKPTCILSRKACSCSLLQFKELFLLTACQSLSLAVIGHYGQICHALGHPFFELELSRWLLLYFGFIFIGVALLQLQLLLRIGKKGLLIFISLKAALHFIILLMLCFKVMQTCQEEDWDYASLNLELGLSCLLVGFCYAFFIRQLANSKNAEITPIFQRRLRVTPQSRAFLQLSCTICLDQYSVGDVVTRLECPSKVPHYFHEHCLKMWLDYARTPECPVCRNPWTPADQALTIEDMNEIEGVILTDRSLLPPQ